MTNIDHSILSGGQNMKTKDFFEDPKEQSIVKSTIVTKYFWAWAKVITSTIKKYGGNKIAYIDLFAGPGRYDDNTKSTPLLVLERAIKDPDMSQMLVTIFNDKDQENVQSLTKAIESLDGIENLKSAPLIYCSEIDNTIVSQFEKMNLVPTLLFVDPWGYKGLSLRLIDSVLKNWGCDCIFFFNYNRINMGLNNDKVKEHMNALFGEQCAEVLRKRLSKLQPYDRELLIVEELSQSFKNLGYQYVLPFRFIDEKRNRTSHHLIFVTKNFRGYNIMKNIMARVSSSTAQGVASFEYNPADKRMPLLFELTRPTDELANMLLIEFSGQTISFKKLYEQHSAGKPYIERNYKDVLLKLESDEKITTSPPVQKRRAGTFGEKVEITFPRIEQV
jgi:three-Cys-motif partner protein